MENQNNQNQQIGGDEFFKDSGGQHNVTDWALTEFQNKYGHQITKDDIWYYLYGVMHAPDWREKYRHDLQRNLPRIPLATKFHAFKEAGKELMDLHANYEACPQYNSVICEVDGQPLRPEIPPPIGTTIYFGK